MQRLKTAKSASGLFLIEIIIAIGFFSLACAVCVQLFVRSHFMSIESRELSRAAICAQTAAEAFKHSDGDMDATAKLLDTQSIKNRIVIFYDSDWNRIAPGEKKAPAYHLMITCFESSGTRLADISVGRAKNDAVEQMIMGIRVKTPV